MAIKTRCVMFPDTLVAHLCHVCDVSGPACGNGFRNLMAAGNTGSSPFRLTDFEVCLRAGRGGWGRAGAAGVCGVHAALGSPDGDAFSGGLRSRRHPRPCPSQQGRLGLWGPARLHCASGACCTATRRTVLRRVSCGFSLYLPVIMRIAWWCP